MHHALIILTLAVIQGHSDPNHGHKKYSIISEIAQAIPTKFAVKTVRLKVCNYDHCQSDDLDLHTRSQVRLKRDYVLTCNVSDNI